MTGQTFYEEMKLVNCLKIMFMFMFIFNDYIYVIRQTLVCVLNYM